MIHVARENESLAPDKIKHKVYAPFYVTQDRERACRICGKMRVINAQACVHCGNKDGFCFRGVEIYA